MSTTRVTANTRLICGRDWDGNIQKLEDTEICNNDVCSLVIRETDLGEDEIDAIVDLLSKVTVDVIHLEDCWARNTDQSTIRLIVALGNCRDVRVSGSTFLSKSFLESSGSSGGATSGGGGSSGLSIRSSGENSKTEKPKTPRKTPKKSIKSSPNLKTRRLRGCHIFGDMLGDN